jgi:tRNA 2-thiouridine synthesizing protein D
MNHPPLDEINWTERWSEWSLMHQIPLKCCITSAVRRGILGEAESLLAEKTQHNCHSAFEISGLGQMMMAMKNTDRVVQF